MDFFDALVRYEVTLWNALDQALGRQDRIGPHRIGMGQLHALRIIDRYDGRARVQELSSDIGITVGAASKLVDRLEREELAGRRPNPANRRSSLIALTAAGAQALAAGMEVCDEALASALGDEDVDALATALHRLQARLTERAAGVPA